MTHPGKIRNRITRVLIVDDHPAVREGLAYRIAHLEDLEVCGEAADVATAVKLVDDFAPHVVIVDISLEESNGIDLIKQLATTHGAVKILVHTMYEESLYADRALDAGAMGFINKREAPEQVIKAIRKVAAGEVYVSDEMTQRILARQRGEQVTDHRPLVGRLSDRELEVFDLIGHGTTTSEIAKRLHLSSHTIDTHREHIKAKLGLRNAAELNHRAVAWVLENR
ncbi:MAG: response regulator transcription factor [Aeoliella sp.]